jgi:NIPSNAP protein
MIVEFRTYHVKPNKMLRELDLYEKHELTPQLRHLGSPLAYLYGESGDINTAVHLSRWPIPPSGPTSTPNVLPSARRSCEGAPDDRALHRLGCAIRGI